MKPLLADSPPSLLKFTAQQISLLALHTFPSKGVGTVREREREWKREDERQTGAATNSRAVVEMGMGTGTGAETGLEKGRRTRMDRKGGEKKSFGIHHVRKEAE